MRGRFAPSPTGLLHMGNAFTALIAWWHVRSVGGEFILRIEDIDLSRSKTTYMHQIMEDLRWHGLDWDEGPDMGGPYGPDCQQERIKRYEDAIERLRATNRLYPCFCSRSELALIASAPHGLETEGLRYPGTCRILTDVEREQKAQVKTPSLRLRIEPHKVSYPDLILVQQTFLTMPGGDFIVQRADGVVAYQLAVVLDDADMKMTPVIRGSD